MKNMKTILKAIVICLLFSQSILLQAQTDKLAFVPKIQYDTATLSGKIEGVEPGDQGFKSLSLSLFKVVTGDRTDYKIPVEKDGTFTFTVPVQCISIAPIASDYFEGLICLIPGEETKLEIRFDSDKQKHVRLINSLGFTADDALNLVAFPSQGSDIGDEIVTPEIFSQRVINGMPDVLNPIEDSPKLSGAAKQILINETKLLCIYYQLFEYERYINDAYANQHKTDTVPKVFHPQMPGKSYYSFLKYFNLNNPSYLSTGSYPMVLQSLLSNETLAIPVIGEMPIDRWLIKVKEILKDDIGSETGLFYDLLVSNAYGKQLNGMNPLNDIQKRNIRFYFTNKSFVDILMDENEKVVQLVANRSKESIFQIDKSSGNVMDSIIAKYKGKVVFVDFWATWCDPCLRAMKESENARKEFENKDVVFLYITDPSSPRKAWEQKISEIGGEHYYPTKKVWAYLNKIYDFNAIPHYLIFDKSGTLKHNYHTFMGNENMRKWIGESL